MLSADLVLKNWYIALFMPPLCPQPDPLTGKKETVQILFFSPGFDLWFCFGFNLLVTQNERRHFVQAFHLWCAYGTADREWDCELWVYPAGCAGTLVQRWAGTHSWLSLLFPVCYRNKWHILSLWWLSLSVTQLAVLGCGGAEGVKSLVGLTQFPSLSPCKLSTISNLSNLSVHCQWTWARLGQCKLCCRQECCYMDHPCGESRWPWFN